VTPQLGQIAVRSASVRSLFRWPHLATWRTVLRRVGGGHGAISPTGPGCRGREKVGELPPRRIREALGETLGLEQAFDPQVFDCDQVQVIEDATAVLLREITASPGDAFMDARDHLPVVGARWRPLLQRAHLLCARWTLARACSSRWKHRCSATSSPVEKGAQVFTPTAMPTRCPVSGQGDGAAPSPEQQIDHVPVLLRLLLAVFGVPSSGRCRRIWTAPPPYHRTRRFSASHWHGNVGIGDAGGASLPAKTGLARRLSRSYAAKAGKEGLEGTVNSSCHVLYHLRLTASH
jgi:hypothetical protein